MTECSFCRRPAKCLGVWLVPMKTKTFPHGRLDRLALCEKHAAEAADDPRFRRYEELAELVATEKARIRELNKANRAALLADENRLDATWGLE